MRPQHQAFRVIGGEVITAGLRIGVMRIERGLPNLGALQIGALAGRFIERQRGARHRGKIRSEARIKQLARAPRMTEPIALRHLARDEIEGALCHRDPVRLIEQHAGIDQRRDHQPVPVRQHLVVEAGPHAAFARVEQDLAQMPELLLLALAALDAS